MFTAFHSLSGPGRVRWGKRAAVLLVALAAALGGGTAAAQDTVEHRLDNGMTVLVRVDRRAPIAVHMVWYRAGAIDEVNGRTGVAHVLEHMMFKGTETLAPGEFSRRVAALGGTENAFTASDYTGYFQQVPNGKLGEVMALEAERMSRLVLDPEEFERELRVVMEERRTRTEDSPRGLLYEAFMATAFVASPYRHPVIGWASDLDSLTVDDARAWYRSWYVPNNALLVVVGDVDPAEVFRQAERTYGRIEARELPPRKPQREPRQRGLRRIEVKAPAEQPVVLMGWKVPSLPAGEGDTDPYALEVLAAILDGGESARLPRRLVRSERIANSVGAGYSLAQRGPALFTLQAVPAQGRNPAELEQALRAEIARVASDGIEDRELARVKTQYVAGRIYARDSVFAQARELGSLEMVGLDHTDADRIIERIRAVEAEDVRRVAERYFGDDTLTVATLVPQPPNGKPVRSELRPAAADGTRH